ncbi:hypothetical protein O4215_20895 [Rhodococcus maanshanensis]|uniref:hypothetical protein n=1 Tax=Rhodococcus maanshanensis TaxID=183556 RepID=UPI0022B5B8F2|nr:hypothetical protein [Rhodococcus maanshanensis]MCZ4558023.1 hypothetical protein [Rhodococcus maanshanensis]
MSGRTRILGIGATAAVAAALLGPGIAVALPGPVLRDASLGLPAIGVGATLSFAGRDDTVSLQVPVPKDMAPTALRGNLQIPAGAGRGWIDAESAGRILGRVEVPAGIPNAPISIPLAGVPVTDGAAQIRLHSHLAPLDDQWCAEDWSENSLTILDGAVDYTGNEAQPTTIDEFLPPVLTRLSIYVPPDPTRDESAAALEFGTAITARFANQSTAVDLRALDPGEALPTAAAWPLERQVVIAESDTVGAHLATSPAGVPVLTLSGRGDALLDQTRLLTSNLAEITAASTATAGTLDAAPMLAPTQTTLGDLGGSSLTATSTGRVTVTVVLDQTRLGRPSGDVRVHLIGNYTPLPSTQNGQLTVTAGDSVLDHWPVSSDGRIDRWIDVPDAALSRFTQLTVNLQVSGAMTCGSTQPVTLTVDPASLVTSTEQLPPTPGGFQALPQAMLPTVDVGLIDGSFENVRRALAVTTGLQHMTVTPMRPELVDLDEAVASGSPAILIAPDGGLPDSVRLPLARTGESTVTLTDLTGESPTQTVDVPSLQFGSVQAAWDDDRDRMLVVATSTGVPASVDRILDWLRADPKRWAALRGEALFQTGDREPVMVSAQQPPIGTGEGSTDSVRGVLIAGGVVLIVGLLAGAAALIGSRRQRQQRP